MLRENMPGISINVGKQEMPKPDKNITLPPDSLSEVLEMPPENVTSLPEMDDAETDMETTVRDVSKLPEQTRAKYFSDKLANANERTANNPTQRELRSEAAREAQRQAIQERENAVQERNAKNPKSVAIAEQAHARREGETAAREHIASFNGDLNRLADYKQGVIQVLEMVSQDAERAQNILDQYTGVNTPEATRIREAQELVLRDAERNAAQYRGELQVIAQFEKTQSKEIALKKARDAVEEAYKELAKSFPKTEEPQKKKMSAEEFDASLQQFLKKEALPEPPENPDQLAA